MKYQPTVVLCTLVINEMEWLSKLYEQHRDWPGMLRWVFVESADRVYAETSPEMASPDGLSVDGTHEFLQDLSRSDKRIVHVPYGFSSHGDPAQGKCQARSQYLREADAVRPDFIFVLDADEFYSCQAQRDVMTLMHRMSNSRDGYCFRHRHPWRPPSVAHLPWNTYEVQGGFWDIPLCRGWKWYAGLRYQTNHNTPETSGGRLLDTRLYRYDKRPRCPECVHMAFASSLTTRRAKHRYYAARGEGRVDFRGWYVESRAAFETWTPSDVLPKGAHVVPYSGPVPECFDGRNA